jgi:streptomycin 6-kinase
VFFCGNFDDKKELIMKIPEHLVSTIQGVHKEKGKEWVENFSRLVSFVEKTYSVKFDASSSYNLSYNFVASATKADGTKVVIKMSVPNSELTSEVNWLKYNKDGQVVHLLEYDQEKGIVILEHLEPGLPLSTIQDEQEAIKIAANLMKTIWKEEPNEHDFSSIQKWASGLSNIKKFYKGNTCPFQEELVTLAEDRFGYLISTIKKPVLVHGDLHQDNILSSSNGWRVIDPKGLIGEAEIDIIPYLKNYLWDKSSPKQVLQSRVKLFSSLLGLKEERILLWGFCLSVLSAWWCVEDGQPCADEGIRLALLFNELLMEL